MIKVTVSTTINRREPVIKDENTCTVSDAIRDAGFSDQRGTWLLNGSPVKPEQQNQTFAQLGYGAEYGKTQVMLTNVVKADNA